MRIETYEQFYPNGRSRVVSQVYIKNLINTMNISGIQPPNNSSWKDYFQNECLNLQQRSDSSKCHISGDWLIFDDSRVSGRDFIFTSYDAFPYTIYELTILAPPLPPLGEFREIGDFEVPDRIAFSQFNETTYKQLASSGMAYTYLVSMPGEVLEVSHGSSSYNAVSFNVLDVVQTQIPIRVKARELNFWQLFMVIAGGIFLFLIFDFAIIWFLREWSHRKEISEDIRRKRELEEARKRIFRKDERLHGNEVYMAPSDGSIQKKKK